MTEQRSVKILAVDDNFEALAALKDVLCSHRAIRFDVITAEDGTGALKAAREGIPDIILLDVNMPPPDGFAVTRDLKADPLYRTIPIILLTANSDEESLLAGLAAGADNYITKPFSPPELIGRIHAMLRFREVLLSKDVEITQLRSALVSRSTYSKMIGHSSAISKVYADIALFKESDLPVLVCGESGTGKELVAREIHYSSRRSSKPLIAVNCAAFNENLLESELFGYVKGAFSGALKDKPGLFEAADGGTLFLDEFGEMSLGMQARLLRVLQEGVFTPVGSVSERKVDVRVITATNRNLPEMIREKRFREDLFYRINVLRLDLPPLRARGADIVALANNFLGVIAARAAKPIKLLSTEAVNILQAYGWPGNIRELENEMERAALLSASETQISAKYLSVQGSFSSNSLSVPGGQKKLKEAVEQLERSLIEAALAAADGNKSEAARELGVSRSNFIAKVQEYGLEDAG